MTMPRNEELFKAICVGNPKAVQEIVQRAIDGKADVVDLLNNSMIPAMRDIGEKFSRNEVFIPEMLIAARAMQKGLNLIEPILAGRGHKPIARVCIGTVQGDLHDVGKNLVAMMLKGAGYQVDDLGVDCSVDKFAAAVDQGSKIVCLSALLTTTMPYIKTVVDAFKNKPGVKVIIGGAPVTQDYANEVGADGYGPDASSAVKVVDSCLTAG